MTRKAKNPLNRNKKNGTRKYRDVCWISTEGKTEEDYFKMRVFRDSKMSIKFPQNINRTHRNPITVLKRFEKALKKNDFRRNDEAWIVVDIDEWNKKEFDDLLEWASKDNRHNLAISNPKFELFILMHFDHAKGCTTSQQVDLKLKQYMPNYDKHLSSTQFNKADIEQAIDNAQKKRASCNDDFPSPGMSDVYKLAKRLLQ